MKNTGMKKVLKYIAMLTLMIVTVSIISMSFFIESNAISYVGTCGNEVEWYLDSRTGTLKIEGTGIIDEYKNYNDIPWYEYRDMINNVVIGEGITSIPKNLFYKTEALTNVEIANSVIFINDYAFYGCAGLKTVTFAKNSKLSIIGESAFAYCRNLSRIEIPTRVMEIKKNAFLYCYRLPDITLGYSVKVIGEDAFSCCSFLDKIRIINYECDIFDDGETIYNQITIEGFDTSTAGTFADKYLRKFSSIKDMTYINDMKIELSKDEYDYNGKVKTPKVTIKGLKENKDFTVDYMNNLNPGIATVTISAAGDTLGEVTKRFKINPAKVQNLRIDSRKEDSLKLTWDEVYGAHEYFVYQFIDNEWKKIDTTDKTSATVKKLDSSVIYKFKVRACTKSGDSKCYGEYSDWLTTATKPQTPVITSISNRGLKRLTVKWSSVNDCDGYEVFIATKKNGNYKSAGETNSRYRCSYVINDLKRNNKYYVKVKAFKLVDNIKVYSADSDIKSMNTM